MKQTSVLQTQLGEEARVKVMVSVRVLTRGDVDISFRDGVLLQGKASDPTASYGDGEGGRTVKYPTL